MRTKSEVCKLLLHVLITRDISENIVGLWITALKSRRVSYHSSFVRCGRLCAWVNHTLDAALSYWGCKAYCIRQRIVWHVLKLFRSFFLDILLDLANLFLMNLISATPLDPNNELTLCDPSARLCSPQCWTWNVHSSMTLSNGALGKVEVFRNQREWVL